MLLLVNIVILNGLFTVFFVQFIIINGMPQTTNLRIGVNAQKSDLLKRVKDGIDSKHCIELYKHFKVQTEKER